MINKDNGELMIMIEIIMEYKTIANKNIDKKLNQITKRPKY